MYNKIRFNVPMHSEPLMRGSLGTRHLEGCQERLPI